MKIRFAFRARERMPLIMQAGIAECGLACLAMILGYYGFITDLVSMRRRFQISSRGITFYDIKEMAEAYNLSSRAVRADWNQIRDFGCPAIVHWDNRHFVVLSRVRRNRAILFDPARGTYSVSRDRFLEQAGNIFLLLTPSSAFTPGKNKTKLQIREVFPINHPLLSNLSQIFIASIMMEGVALLLPVFFQFGIDRIPTTGNLQLLGIVAVGFLFLVAFNFVVDVLRGRIVIFVKARLNVEMDSQVYKRLLYLPQAYFSNRHPGDTLSRFDSLKTIQDTLSGAFVETVLDGIMIVGTLVLMSFYSLALTAIVLALYCLYLLVRRVWYRNVREANETLMIAQAQRETELVESVRGIQAIKIFRKEENRLHRWGSRVISSVNADAKVGLLALIYKSSSELIMGISNVLVIWVGLIWVLHGKLTIGMLVAFMAFKNQFINKGSLLLDRIIDYVSMQVHVARVSDIVSSQPEMLTSGVAPGTETAGGNNLEILNVSYRYGAHLPFVLDGFSLDVKDGECLAIKGPSGIGKSTLAKLILGLITPEEGELRLGGKPYSWLGLNYVRDAIGAVMQDDIVFDGSILDNISFFDELPNMEWIEECARLANIHNDIVSMPMRYETLMGNLGTALSGGQKQRVLIARALYKRPRLLILDEATSHLDPKNEQAVGEAVSTLSLTRIVFAHRQTTLQLADRVVNLERLVQDSPPSKAQH